MRTTRFLTRLALIVPLTGLLGADVGSLAVKPQVYERERLSVPDIYVLEFSFWSPRYVMVDVPGEGRKLLWYMKYNVVNTSGKPRLFIPQFTLVTDKGKVHTDVVIPSAEKAIMMREDPTKPYYNSVTISESPIPNTPEESLPQSRQGVAIWEGIDMGTTKSFEIFVTGLSNGYVKTEDPKSKESVMRRKTLKLTFSKPGDEFYPDPKEIRFTGEPVWTYR